MSWLAENWEWVFFGGGFIGLHLFGHRMGGGCGGHGHRRHAKARDHAVDKPPTDGRKM